MERTKMYIRSIEKCADKMTEREIRNLVIQLSKLSGRLIRKSAKKTNAQKSAKVIGNNVLIEKRRERLVKVAS